MCICIGRLATPIADSPMADSFSLAKGQESSDARHQADAQNGEGEQVSAADYDPSLDRREDEQKRFRGADEERMQDDVEEEVDPGLSSTSTDYHQMRRTLVNDNVESRTYKWHPTAGKVYRHKPTVFAQWQSLFQQKAKAVRSRQTICWKFLK